MSARYRPDSISQKTREEYLSKYSLTSVSLFALAITAGLTSATTAWAADGALVDAAVADAAVAATSAADEATGLEEVVVVARRRNENLQEVPTAVTAITAQDLQEKNIQTTRELAISTPSLNVGGNFSSSFMSFSMRGNVPNANTSGFTDPTVQTYFNEVAPIFASAATFFDLDSVEVLRGPQGTLFGRTAIGGAVLFQPHKPGWEFGGFVRGAVGNYQNRELEFALNVPIVDDRVALRLAGNLLRREGYTKILNQNNFDLDNRHSDAFRASLLLRPTDQIESLTIFDYHNVDQHSGSYHLIAARPTGAASIFAVPSNAQYAAFLAANPDLAALPGVAGGLQSYFQNTIPALGPRRQYDNVDSSILIFKDRVKFISNTTSVDLGPVTIKNILAYQSFYLGVAYNVDGTPLPIFEAASLPGLPTSFHQDYRQLSEELQISGKLFAGKVDWLTGFYYQKNHDVRPGASQGFVSFAFRGFLARETQTDRDLTNTAFFAHTVWHATDQLSVTLGGRITKDITKTDQFLLAAATNSRGTVIGPLSCGGNPALPFNVNTPQCKGPSAHLNDKGVTWVGSVDYQWTPDTLVYVASRRGYQPALVNTTSSILQYLVTPKSRTDDVEVGLKSQGKIGGFPWRFNAAAYYQWLKDAHRSGYPLTDPRTGGSIGAVLTVQKATVKGIELELKALPTPWLEVSAFADVTDANYKEFTTPILAADPADPNCANPVTRTQCNTVQTGTRDFSGDKFTYTPKNHFGATARVALPVPEDFGQASFTATYYHQAKYYFASFIQEPESLAEAQNLVNLRLDWKGVMGSRVDVGAYVKNATNQTYVVGGAGQEGSVGITYGLYGEPRMYGVDFRVQF